MDRSYCIWKQTKRKHPVRKVRSQANATRIWKQLDAHAITVLMPNAMTKSTVRAAIPSSGQGHGPLPHTHPTEVGAATIWSWVRHSGRTSTLSCQHPVQWNRAVCWRRLSMNLAIPPRKPIRVSDRAGFEPDPLRHVKGSALRDPFVGGSGKLLALKCCEGTTNLHRKSREAGWDAGGTRCSLAGVSKHLRKVFHFKFTHVISAHLCESFLTPGWGALVPVTHWVYCWPAVNRSPQTNRERVSCTFSRKKTLTVGFTKWLQWQVRLPAGKHIRSPARMPLLGLRPLPFHAHDQKTLHVWPL